MDSGMPPTSLFCAFRYGMKEVRVNRIEKCDGQKLVLDTITALTKI